MILILDLCLGLITLASLYAISLGFEIETILGGELLWLGAGALAVACFHCWLGEKAAALFDGGRARKKTAEGIMGFPASEPIRSS
ncbi:MAG: hypothetical protein N3D11_05160 [Candidatus Sumerlaeia bacterium]|nr:hypothetical protein [Candidatus Sumerlaeia bacterium]